MVTSDQLSSDETSGLTLVFRALRHSNYRLFFQGQGISLIGFFLSRHFLLSLLLMLPTGFGMIVEMTSTNTVLQTLVEEEKRGRVMSFHMMAIVGMAPFGSLLSGGLASHIGAPGAVMVSGIACIMGSVLFARKLPALRQMARPIYVEKGIIKGGSTN